MLHGAVVVLNLWTPKLSWVRRAGMAKTSNSWTKVMVGAISRSKDAYPDDAFPRFCRNLNRENSETSYGPDSGPLLSLQVLT